MPTTPHTLQWGLHIHVPQATELGTGIESNAVTNIHDVQVVGKQRIVHTITQNNRPENEVPIIY